MPPYMPQNPYPGRGVPGESSDSSEEVPKPQGHAWAVPPTTTQKPWVTNDRREYGRTSDNFGAGSGTRWSVPETSQPQPGIFQPSTWRGMGRGFEQRPGIPSRFNSTQEGRLIDFKLCALKIFIRKLDLKKKRLHTLNRDNWLLLTKIF